MSGRIAGRGNLSQGNKISAGVSQAEGQFQGRHLTDTNKDDLTWVTTTPRGKRREQCERQGKAESDLLEEEHIIRQQMEILNQKQLHAEAEQAAARAASDREVARERLLLQHRQETLKRQRYREGNITKRSNIPGHGGDAQSMPNDRHDHVATEWGAHMRCEQKITSRNTQDQSSTAGQFGGKSCYSPRPRKTLQNQDHCATDTRGCFAKGRYQVYFKNKQSPNQL